MVAFNGRIHWRFALLIWIFLVVIPKNPIWLNPIPLLVGSLFPDADHKKAPMGRIIPLWLFFRHRGFTHTWYGLIVFSLPLWLIFDEMIALAFAIGYFTHLMMDATTPSGIKWFGK